MDTKLRREKSGSEVGGEKDAKRIGGRTISRRAAAADIAATIELTKSAGPDKSPEEVTADYFIKSSGFTKKVPKFPASFYFPPDNNKP